MVCRRMGRTGVDIPSFWYSSMVFFSPTLKPSVCSACRSSSWSPVMVDGGGGDGWGGVVCLGVAEGGLLCHVGGGVGADV